MNSSPERPPFPERILVANIAASERNEVRLELISEHLDWGDLPTSLYVRADETE